MADDRKCYAGDLTSDAIGKTIDLGDEVIIGPVRGIEHHANKRGVITTAILTDDTTHRLYHTATVTVR